KWDELLLGQHEGALQVVDIFETAIHGGRDEQHAFARSGDLGLAGARLDDAAGHRVLMVATASHFDFSAYMLCHEVVVMVGIIDVFILKGMRHIGRVEPAERGMRASHGEECVSTS
ncbi:hypothetical protein GW17_00038892, partial [Ensete ventricosum]